MKYAFVTTNLLDLWAEPRFNCERLSQLLFGEVVRVESEKDGYCHVIQDDGYRGWVDKRFLGFLTKSDAEAHKNDLSFIISSASARVYSKTRRLTPPFTLYYGTRLAVRQDREDLARVILPHGMQLYIKKSGIRPIIGPKAEKPTGPMIVAEARRFLGVPYLWGGITACGFDCSGLVRAVYSRFGICLPRDTKDQITVGQKVERQSIRTGDLVFFKRHVGIAIGKASLIHASLGGGGVRINSLVREGPNYREDLDRDFITARRLL